VWVISNSPTLGGGNTTHRATCAVTIRDARSRSVFIEVQQVNAVDQRHPASKKEPSMNRRPFLTALTALEISFGSLLAAQTAVAGETQLRGYTFSLPEGFTVEIAAERPLVKYPICADFDEEGRLYVCVASGAKDWNQPQPKETRHRVLRLEDPDGDGQFDRRTVFAEFEMLAQGSMYLDGSLYVAAPPIIWKLTDVDGDGVADEREKWIETEETKLCLNDLRGPYLGPDGWIYWCKGAGATHTYQVDGKPWSTTARHIFRRHPDRRDVEHVMVGGMDNPIEVAFSRTGERFLTNTNIQLPGRPRKDGILHAVYGGVYPRDISPIYEFPWSGPELMPALTSWGALAPCGLARYDSGEYGDGYRDNLFSCLFSGHKVMRHVIQPRGATYQARDEDFLTCNDVEFHPTDVLADADGSLLVLETGGWYLHCCPSSTFYRPERDGAIYRIRRQGAHRIEDPRGKELAWEDATPGQLGKRLRDHRVAVRNRAVYRLGKLGSAAVPALERTIVSSDSVDARSLAVWAATRIDAPAARAAVRRALSDPDATVQQVALNSTSLWRDREAVPQLQEHLSHASAQLRRVAAEALGRIGDSAAVPALLRALSKPTDRFLDHSLTFALIEIADPTSTRLGLSSASDQTRRAAMIALDQMHGGSLDPRFVVAQLDSPTAIVEDTAWWILLRHSRDWGALVAENLRRQVASTTLTETERRVLVSRLAGLAHTPELAEWIAAELSRKGVSLQTQILLLQAMDGAGGRWADDRWIEVMLDLLSGTLDTTVVTQLVSTLSRLPPIRIKDETSRNIETSLNAQLRETGKKEDLAGATRLVALSAISSETIGHVDDDLFGFLLSRIGPDQTLHLRTAAADVLSRCRLEKRQLLRLAAAMKNLAPSELNRVLDVFRDASDDDVGHRLVASLGGSSAVTTLNAFRLKRSLASFGPSVQEQTGPLFRRLELAQAEQLARALRITELATSADHHRGLQVFRSNRAACATCHKAAHVGGTFGPHLKGIGERRSMQDLVESILFPSASIVQSYETHVVVTSDGRVASGVIQEDSPREVVISSAPDKTVRIARDAIAEIRRSDISSMPEGIDKTLTEQQLADLAAYLKSLK
jgi:putative membrane-bound dehydrogenase-like protein